MRGCVPMYMCVGTCMCSDLCMHMYACLHTCLPRTHTHRHLTVFIYVGHTPTWLYTLHTYAALTYFLIISNVVKHTWLCRCSRCILKMPYKFYRFTSVELVDNHCPLRHLTHENITTVCTRNTNCTLCSQRLYWRKPLQRIESNPSASATYCRCA